MKSCRECGKPAKYSVSGMCYRCEVDYARQMEASVCKGCELPKLCCECGPVKELERIAKDLPEEDIQELVTMAEDLNG